jgi:Flp pilus assembly pilin Flp
MVKIAGNSSAPSGLGSAAPDTLRGAPSGLEMRTMSWIRRSAVGQPAERGATVVTYALMIAIATLLLSAAFMFLQGGVGLNLRRGGNCIASVEPGFDPGVPCPRDGKSGGGPGPPPGTTTSTSSTTSTIPPD